jgi:hypothetical protein
LKDVQTFRCTERQRRSQREKAEVSQLALAEVFVFGRDLKAMMPVTMLIVCSFVLHRPGRIVYL